MPQHSKKLDWEIYSVASDATEFISWLTYFQRRLPKTRRYTLKCVTRPPAGKPGHTPFSEIQDYDLLYLQILVCSKYLLYAVTDNSPSQESLYWHSGPHIKPRSVSGRARYLGDTEHNTLKRKIQFTAYFSTPLNVLQNQTKFKMWDKALMLVPLLNKMLEMLRIVLWSYLLL